jgi:hypothetical protein
MRTTNSILLVLCGIAIGITSTMSCGDDVTGNVDARPPDGPPDAAVCDCPPAEKPLTGRFVVVSNTQEIPANDTGGTSVPGPLGAQLLSGSCTTELPNPVRDVTLQQSGFHDDPSGWICRFRNNSAAPVTIKASAICLVPAP